MGSPVDRRRSRFRVCSGCGGDRDNKKRPLMAAAAETFANRVFVTPDNPRSESIHAINNEIAKGFKKNIHSFHTDRVNGIYQAVEWLKEGDILAVVGKGCEEYQITGSERTHHSDVETIKQALKEMVGDEN